MALIMILVKFLFLLSMVSCEVTLQNPDFESRPLNLTTNATSQFVLLDAKINAIPGWSFNGTVWYVTAGDNISLPGNGHGLQLGPNGKINQTFKSDGSYDYVLTFTLAPSSTDCANNSTAVNVSGPGHVSNVFFFQESLGNEMWQTHAYSLGSREDARGLMSLEIQSVANNTLSRSNITCWPIIDALLVTGIEPPTWYTITNTSVYNGFANSGFEVGPAFLNNSSQGILLEADSNIDPSNSVKSPLQDWTILGIVKYIDSRNYAVPEGRAAIELVSGNPSGIQKNVLFSRNEQVTLDFTMGDDNDSCVGDFTVFVQVGNTIRNFTMRSIGVGSTERHSVTFNVESSSFAIPISFFSFNETRTSNHQVLCGPVIDSTVLLVSSGSRSEKLHNGLGTFSFVFAVIFLFLA